MPYFRTLARTEDNSVIGYDDTIAERQYTLIDHFIPSLNIEIFDIS